MALTFHGKWIVEVVSLDAGFFSERFVISGAVVGNGIHPGVVGAARVLVDGLNWQITFEWNDLGLTGWQPSDERRIAAGFSLDKGLFVTVGVDDNFPAARDHDFNDLIVRLRNIDPPLNPFVPIVNLPDFTFKRSAQQHPGGPAPARPGSGGTPGGQG